MLSSQHQTILSVIRDNQSQSLEQLHKATGMQARTVKTIVEDLKRVRLVEVDWSTSTPGYKIAESHILVG